MRFGEKAFDLILRELYDNDDEFAKWWDSRPLKVGIDLRRQAVTKVHQFLVQQDILVVQPLHDLNF